MEDAAGPREVEGELPLEIEVGDQELRVEGMHRAVVSVGPQPSR